MKDPRRFIGNLRWMNQVCNNPRNPDYPNNGAQGIKCHWTTRDYAKFEAYILRYLGPQPTGHILCRKNKTGDFAPGNLEWQTPRYRSNHNPRQNIYVKYKNKTQTIRGWSNELKIPYHTVRRRILKGCKISDIIQEFHNV